MVSVHDDNLRWDPDSRKWIDKRELRSSGPIMPLQAMDLEALAGTDPVPVSFIIAGLVPEGEVTLLTAPGGGNKTTLCLMLATAMAARLDQCLGLTIIPGPAAYIGMEDSEPRLHWMLHHICAGLGVSIVELVDRLHLVSMRQVIHNGLARFERDGELVPEDLFEQARLLVEDTGARLLVLDNLAHLFLGNENDRMQATRFLGLLNKLASDTGAAILLLAHTPKSGDPHSGSTAWVNAVRSHASIEKDEDGDPDLKVLKVSKGNYVRPGEVTRFRWFEHHLVRPEDLPEGVAEQLAATSRANAANAAFLKCLAAVTEQGRAVSHARGANSAPRIFAKMPEGRGFDQDDYEAAMERLLHLGVIRGDEEVGKYANRTARRGLKQVADLSDEGAQSPAQSSAQEGAQSPAPGAQNPSERVHNELHTQSPYLSGKDGGTMDGPPPSEPSGEGELSDGWVPGDE